MTISLVNRIVGHSRRVLERLRAGDSSIEPTTHTREERAMQNTKTSDRPPSQSSEQDVSIRWDDSQMRSAYANVCNVNGTREEIVLMFGVNQTWTSASKEVVIQLLERVILSPYAAKRLNLLLSRVLKGYETRYGQLPLEVGDQARPAEPLPTG
jgi:hypothetical protein